MVAMEDDPLRSLHDAIEDFKSEMRHALALQAVAIVALTVTLIKLLP